MSLLGIIVLLIVISMLCGSFPIYPYSRGWGPYPAGGMGLLLLIVIVLLIARVI